MSNSITVVGAGSVGIGTAIHLLQRGFDVTLIDRKKPATETSYGNAGVINGSSFIPFNNPELFRKLPSLLLNNKSYMRYNFPYALKNLNWITNFLLCARTESTKASAAALFSLCESALDEHRALMQRAGNMHRLTEAGWLKVMRHGSGFDRSGLTAKLYKQYGIEIEDLSASDIQQLEPALSSIYSAGYLIKVSASVNNPRALLQEYVSQFVADGGRLVEREVTGLKESAEGGFVLHTTAGDLLADKLVVCAGPWSGDFIKELGYKTMLGFERGYHQHFKLNSEHGVTRTVQDIDGGFILAPMEQGIRITTGVELNHRDAPSSYKQLDQVLPRVREAIDLGDATDDPVWRGCRPTFPDSRPVIDRAPAHDNLWLAFGHQHIGLMSGPVTGKLLAQKISNEKTDIDLTPFASSRWIKKT